MEKRKVKTSPTASVSSLMQHVFLLECYTVKSQLEASYTGLSSLPAESAYEGSWVLCSLKGTCKMILKRTRDSSTGFFWRTREDLETDGQLIRLWVTSPEQCGKKAQDAEKPHNAAWVQNVGATSPQSRPSRYRYTIQFPKAPPER